jgi:hypothetical protein
MHMRNAFKIDILLLLIVLFASGCFHLESPHHGKILDAETRQPINNATVSLLLEYVCGLPPNPGGPTHQFLGNIENRSDSQGYYSLPLRFYFLSPLSCSNDQQFLNIIKAGYFPSIIEAPSFPNNIDLYPINYYIDYLYYQRASESGDLNPFYFGDHPVDFKEYHNELTKIAMMQFRKNGEEGVIAEVPGARFTKLSCTSKFVPLYRGGTLGIDGIVCTVFDQASDKWCILDSRGNLIVLNDLGVSSDEKIWTFDLAGRACTDFDNKSGDWKIIEQSGNLNRAFRSCLTPNDLATTSIFLEDNRHSACIVGIAYGKERVCTTFNEEIDAVKYFGRSVFFIKFANGTIKKYTHSFGKEPLKEVKSFYECSHDLFEKKTINSFDVGRAVQTPAIYFTAGDDKIYRLNFDGVPDSKIEILTNKSNGQ